MALTISEYIAELEEERDVLQAKLKAIADAGDDYDLPGSLVDAPGGGASHSEFYDRWQKRLATINTELASLQDQDVFMEERRGTA